MQLCFVKTYADFDKHEGGYQKHKKAYIVSLKIEQKLIEFYHFCSILSICP